MIILNFVVFQGIDPHRKQELYHVEYESHEWDNAFKIFTPLNTIAESVREWCRRDKGALISTLR